MTFTTPTSLDEALGLLAADGGLRPIAGGTDLLVSWPQRDTRDWRLLDLSRIAELRGVVLEDGWLTLGALASYWDVIDSGPVRAAFPLLEHAARQVGAMQIQTRGTWAGNIANGSPAADGVPALMVYDARVVLASRRGRREAPLETYFTGYKQSVRAADELIVAIRVPCGAHDRAWFHKVGARAAQTITKVGVAITHGPAGWRVAVNSVAPFVCRCRHMEAALEAGRGFGSPEEVRAVLDRDIAPIDDLRSNAEYRAAVLARLVYFWWREHVAGDRRPGA